MNTVPGQRDDVFIFYPQAGAFVGYLIEEYGADTMARYLAGIDKGQAVLKNFNEVYGRSIYEVENDWRSNFNATPITIPSPTSKPDKTIEHSIRSTPVPLLDYRTISKRTSNTTTPTSTVSPLITVAENSDATGRNNISTRSSSNQLVSTLTIILAIIIGLCFIAFLYRNYKPNS
jgi:hypothetical protein